MKAISVQQDVLSEDITILPSVSEGIKCILSSKGITAEVLGYLQKAKGKMIRPLLVQKSLQICQGEICEAVIDVATGIELVHLASLVHDDVIDQSFMRRGIPTLYQQFGPSVAVLAGDFLFASAFSLFTKHRADSVLTAITQVIRTMCEGEIEQLLTPSSSEKFYWHYIYCKTASLIGAACRAGALLSPTATPQWIAGLAEVGLNYGYAFQLVDDLLDWVGNSDQMGKQPGIDWAAGIWTLPVIRAYQRGIIPVDWNVSCTLGEISETLTESGILTEVRAEAESYVRRAQNILEQFPASTHQRFLRDLGDFILAREL